MDHQGFSRQNDEKRLILSKEEERIRDELEMEIERNLEGEFKDGIYNLALKLRRLYEQRREREESSIDIKSKRVLEVNIGIKLEGDTKIEITERKKEEDIDKTKKIKDLSKNKKSVAGDNKTRKITKIEDLSKNKKFVAGEDNETRKGKMKMKNLTSAHELRWKW